MFKKLILSVALCFFGSAFAQASYQGLPAGPSIYGFISTLDSGVNLYGQQDIKVRVKPSQFAYNLPMCVNPGSNIPGDAVMYAYLNTSDANYATTLSMLQMAATLKTPVAVYSTLVGINCHITYVSLTAF